MAGIALFVLASILESGKVGSSRLRQRSIFEFLYSSYTDALMDSLEFCLWEPSFTTLMWSKFHCCETSVKNYPMVNYSHEGPVMMQKDFDCNQPCNSYLHLGKREIGFLVSFQCGTLQCFGLKMHLHQGKFSLLGTFLINTSFLPFTNNNPQIPVKVHCWNAQTFCFPFVGTVLVLACDVPLLSS